MYPIVDLHMHVTPGIDDGSCSIEESLELLKLSISQGVTDIFCASHSGCIKDNAETYNKNLQALKDAVTASRINIRLHKGCEVLCSKATIDSVLHRLETGVFTTLGDSNFVLTELYPDIELEEALFIIDELKKHGYRPIIAHMERIYSLTGTTIGILIRNGALIQVNVQDLVDENDASLRERARQLLENKYVHFIGSDGHRVNYRPPSLSPGVDYILKNTDADYATEILSKNALNLIIKDV